LTNVVAPTLTPTNRTKTFCHAHSNAIKQSMRSRAHFGTIFKFKLNLSISQINVEVSHHCCAFGAPLSANGHFRVPAWWLVAWLPLLAHRKHLASLGYSAALCPADPHLKQHWLLSTALLQWAAMCPSSRHLKHLWRGSSSLIRHWDYPTLSLPRLNRRAILWFGTILAITRFFVAVGSLRGGLWASIGSCGASDMRILRLRQPRFLAGGSFAGWALIVGCRF